MKMKMIKIKTSLIDFELKVSKKEYELNWYDINIENGMLI